MYSKHKRKRAVGLSKVFLFSLTFVLPCAYDMTHDSRMWPFSMPCSSIGFSLCEYHGPSCKNSHRQKLRVQKSVTGKSCSYLSSADFSIPYHRRGHQKRKLNCPILFRSPRSLLQPLHSLIHSFFLFTLVVLEAIRGSNVFLSILLFSSWTAVWIQ